MTATEAPRTSARDVVRPLVQLVANVTVVTALLVYFGWRRSEAQSRRLGFAESVLQMSTRDYVLRSVGPVLALLVGVAVAGLLWVLLDRAVYEIDGGPPRELLWALGSAWLVLPLLVVLLGYVAEPVAFVLFPASIGVGVLLLLYAVHLGRFGPRTDADDGRRHVALQLSTGLLAVVAVFWTANNYAHVEGVRFADEVRNDVTTLPAVRVYSENRLHLDGPGVTEQRLAAASAEERAPFRYAGLRLLERTGGRFFLLSDEWTIRRGVLFVVDDDDAVRLEFVRGGG